MVPNMESLSPDMVISDLQPMGHMTWHIRAFHLLSWSLQRTLDRFGWKFHSWQRLGMGQSSIIFRAPAKVKGPWIVFILPCNLEW